MNRMDAKALGNISNREILRVSVMKKFNGSVQPVRRPGIDALREPIHAPQQLVTQRIQRQAARLYGATSGNSHCDRELRHFAQIYRSVGQRDFVAGRVCFGGVQRDRKIAAAPMLKVVPMRRARRVVDEDGEFFSRAALRNGYVVAAGNQYKVRVTMSVGKNFVRLLVGHSVRDDYSVATVGKLHATIKLAGRKAQAGVSAHAAIRGVEPGSARSCTLPEFGE